MAGKFLYVGEEKLWVRGVTYGPFRPDASGSEYPRGKALERDLVLMAANGINAIRTYTVPPPALLDAAARHGLFVLVGLPWEQHVTFLDDRRRMRAIAARVRDGVRACARHPAVLAYSVGNEIPAPIVRWHGRRRVERFLLRLTEAARGADPGGLVTYVNYPTTEYLELPFVDLLTFNVYLEAQERLEAYLARLQNIAGDRPLVMAEIGLDSRRHGEFAQARVLDWQVRTAFAAGCAGAFVFAWTDEWHRGGFDIEDWDFGLTDRQRRPKPALSAVRRTLDEVPFPKGNEVRWPRISVVVCSYNGARTIGDCLEGLRELEYPNFEVIVVNDGSTDATPDIVRDHGFRMISTPNRGLSSARNTGLAAATGDIVAYIDDDARPDPHWLTFLAHGFMTTSHAGMGGPNIPPPDDGRVARCVAHAPGGPAHVLVADREAEHLPGCNMAFRRESLLAVGGFDAQFRTAGDDVDVCWALQRAGLTLGFSAAAMVWHRRRNSVRAYWRQQRGYGLAEALLERKWPEKYNGVGHARWTGRVYANGLAALAGWRRPRVYHGAWGSAPFQSLYHPASSTFWSIVTMPEWYLVVAGLASLSLLGALWTPLLTVLPLLALSVAAPVALAWYASRNVTFAARDRRRRHRLAVRLLTAALHLVQPLARLRGRLDHGLGPWRWRQPPSFVAPTARGVTLWAERWKSLPERLQFLEDALRETGAVPDRGGDFDRWDLEVRGGLLGGARVQTTVEEHGAGCQLVRFLVSPTSRPSAWMTALVLAALAAAAFAYGAAAAAVILTLLAAAVAIRIVLECGAAMANVLRGIQAVARREDG